MRICLLFAAAAALGACSSGQEPPTAAREEVSGTAAPDASSQRPGKSGDPASPDPVKIALPQLAYSYDLGFVLPGDRIAGAQEAHRKLCARMGPARCQLIALERGGGPDRSGAARLELRVASSEAQRFSDALTRAVADAGGRSLETKVAAEDVSKQLVDTQARIAQRELLVARLTAILRTRNGKVSELVEAERSVAQAQEELDQAKAWLAELRGRVAMSDFTIRYAAVAPSASPGNLGTRLGEAISGSGAAFLIGLRTLLTLAIYLLPWALLAAPLVLFVRARNRRKRDSARDHA